MICHELLAQAATLLDDANCESPRLDAELLLMHTWQIERTALIIRMPEEVPEDIETAFWPLLSRRQLREPVAYITGLKEFWSLPFRVDERVLIPRPETEHLIEKVLALFTDRTGAWRFADIGTGSGCIACATASEFPNAMLTATDISEDALNVARYNAMHLNLTERIDFRQGEMLAALNPEGEKFDAIISNPPYVALTEMDELEPELAYEPKIALTDGGNGRGFLSQLFEQSRFWLKPGGYLIVETGICGLPQTPDHLTQIEHYRDLAGIERGGIYRLHCNGA